MHRYIMSEHMGRPLVKGEVVHHRDCDKLNNNIENLELMTIAEHNSLHKKGKHYPNYPNRMKKYVLLKCPQCHNVFVRNQMDTHLQQSHNRDTTCCSKSCSNKFRYLRKSLTKQEVDKLIADNIIHEFSTTLYNAHLI